MYTSAPVRMLVFGLCFLALLTTGTSAPRRSISIDPAQNIISTVAGNLGSGFSGDNGPAVLSGLTFPSGVAVDGAGNFFIVDSTFRVRKVNPQGIVTTVAGNGTPAFSGDGGAATSAEIYARGIAADSAGTLFIADTYNNRIRKVTPDGTISTIAGTGTGGFSGDGGPGTAAQLLYPEGVAVDAAGNVWIADTGNHCVRELTAAGIISTVAGTGASGYSGDGGAAGSAQLASPFSVALDGSGNLLIADTGNNRIRIVSAGVITTIAGNGVSGNMGDGGPAVSAELNGPSSVVADSAGNVFISDFGNQRVRRVNSSGVIADIAGTGTAGFGGDGGPAPSALLNGPEGLAVDATGSLLIADQDNNRIRKVRTIPAGMPAITSITPTSGVRGSTFVAKIVGVNLSGATAISFSGTGVSATISSVDSATGLTISITISPDAALTIRTFAVTTASGQSDFAAGLGVAIPPDSRVIGTAAGSGSSGFSGDGSAATSAQLNYPTSLAVDSAGNVFIADKLNNRIRKISTSGVISTVAGSGTAGFSGDGGPATGAALSGPTDVAVDGGGNLFIADLGNNRVRKVNTNGFISTVAGNGASTFSGDGGRATSAALCPWGLAIDSSGNLFIGDGCNERVLMVNADGIISTVAGSGMQGFKGDGGPANEARLSGPTRLALDAAGDLFIVDSLSNRVREVDTEGIIHTVAGNGGQGFDTTEGSPATSVQVYPWAIAFDAIGNLLICDNNRVRMVDSTGAIFTIAGGGSGSGDGNPATFVSLQGPQGIAVDATGTIFIADAYADTVRTVSAAGAGSGAPLLTSIGIPSSGIQGTTVSTTLNGYNLNGVSSVLFSGTGVTAVVNGVGTNTSLPVTISIAAGAAATTRTVTVATAIRISNSLTGFTVNTPASPGIPAIGSNVDGSPKISVLTAAQGTTVAATVFGTGFTGATAVTFGGTGVTANILSGGTDAIIPIFITVAANASLGDHPVSVTTTVGTSSQRSGFSVVAAASGNIITTIAGGACCGYGGTGRPAINTSLSTPAGIAADAAGNVFFAESGTNLVRRINPFGIMDSVTGEGSGFFGDGGPATQAVLSNPVDVALDSNGNLYIADFGNQRVRKVSPAGIITTVAGNGASASGGDGGPATAALLLSPSSIAVDSAGNLYIADWNRVRKVDSQGVINTVAGNGTSGFAGDGGQATSAELSPICELQ